MVIILSIIRASTENSIGQSIIFSGRDTGFGEENFRHLRALNRNIN